jgi:dipeptidyl aminopeptidase/acylaminoacyl peptidase
VSLAVDREFVRSSIVVRAVTNLAPVITVSFSCRSKRAAFVRAIILASIATTMLSATTQAEDKLPPMTEIRVASSVDGTMQPCLLWVPNSAKDESRPLLIWLHTWSYDYRQSDKRAYQQQAVKRSWFLLAPNFRGPNDRPEAGGSLIARTDILDAIDYVEQHFNVDSNRIYLAGESAGAQMALLEAGYNPTRFSAVSAWVPVTDLADWYHYHSQPGRAMRYANGVTAVCGGIPAASDVVDGEYRSRSPVYHLDKTNGLPVEIAVGVNDTEVPIKQSLRAYNAIAKSNGNEEISGDEMEQLQTKRRLDQPHSGDQVVDESFGCEVLLRRNAGDSRITVFQGGHISLPEACCEWLEQHRRATKN